MPTFTIKPSSTNDPSQLTAGWHPAVLVEIADEETPDGWIMKERNPRLYRWQFRVWSRPEDMATQEPERQSAVSSQAFTPKGRNPASKAYTWTVELLGRMVLPGEAVDLDPLMPIPCRVKIERKEQYANIIDLERWEDGAALLTEPVRRKLGPTPAAAQAQSGESTGPAAKRNEKDADDSEPW